MDAQEKSKSADTGQVNELNIIYFTDPLCCWSWGMQPHLDALQAQYGEKLSVQYVMGGMLPSWDRFRDDANSVSRPVQMGPVWMHAAQLTGRPMNHFLWVKDPPSSSYPACIAVKCAELQSRACGTVYFKHVQEAAMVHAKNIALWNELESVANEIARENKYFNAAQFALDYKNENGTDAFRADLELAAKYKITRFPTMVVESPGKKPIIMSGYRTLEGITDVLTRAFDTIENDRQQPV